MAQQSITSFFKKINHESEEKKSDDCEEVIKPKIKRKNPFDGDSPEKKRTSNVVPESKETNKESFKEHSPKKGSELKITSAGEGKKGADYNPSKKNYNPITDAFWSVNEKVPYLALARTFELIESESSRLKMIEILSNFFRSVIALSKTDLVASIYLCLNQLAPAYEGVELGVAETYLMKAIAQSTGRELSKIKNEVQKEGDLGIVAEKSRSNQKMMFQPAAHTIDGVFTKLRTIANLTGHSSMNKKIDMIQLMFVACRHSEARFLIRSLAGKLRIGLAEQSVLQALAQACAMTPPNLDNYEEHGLNQLINLNETAAKSKVDNVALIIKETYCRCPDYNKIIPVLIQEGIDGLEAKCKMVPGVPLKPMLALPTKGVHEIFERFEGQEFTCEWKYDGERAQIHINDEGKVYIYSRNSENNTSKYPDIISRIESVKKSSVESCILDCEAVAWDCENKKILPFQILSTRKRKDVSEADIKVQVCVFMFDLLYLNGASLIKEPFYERRRLLHEHFQEKDGEWKFATKIDSNDIEQVQQFLDEAVKGNCEGLMVKTLKTEATYEIAKRSKNWLKLKKDYLSNVGDSLDLVVIGGYQGKGKRTGTYGGFLLACYDNENEEFQSICKIGTGFSDEDLINHSSFLKNHIIKEPKHYFRYEASHEPDDWFEPIQVWEIKCADLSISPVYKAAVGIVDAEKGISLRFPRFIRIRDDKTIEDSTTAQQIADMYSNQDQIKNQDQTGKSNEEDFY
ncbi:DNA ligase 1 [Culicoides brevitarsis]|uniref:DNA ligase 1 n=1 Tax=Culicoides brevitarsis TaxID=469753 RepID=UPI00307CBF09